MNKIDEMAFFRKPSGQLAYHKKCTRCVHKCMQSFRVKWLECPSFTRADCTKTSEKALDEKKQDKGELAR